jgi:Stress responsive A/B Barrel Domain
MSLQHIILFKFPRELTAEEDAQLRAMVASWPEKIGLMTKVRLGSDITGARNRGYSLLLYTEFPDFETMTAYREHPVHVEFLSFTNELGCEPLAFDYYLDEHTVLMPE